MDGLYYTNFNGLLLTNGPLMEFMLRDIFSTKFNNVNQTVVQKSAHGGVKNTWKDARESI